MINPANVNTLKINQVNNRTLLSSNSTIPKKKWRFYNITGFCQRICQIVGCNIPDKV